MGRTQPSDAGWQSLNTPSSELRLESTLPTGQSFRWRKTGPQQYTGVIEQRVVQMQQEDNDVVFRVLARGAGALPSEDGAALHNYFNLDSRLADLSRRWADSDSRFNKIQPYFPGARVLRQDPVECLFQFICSSNNHISRIHGMVERLCRMFGTPLPVVADANLHPLPQDLSFYAFPTLENLQEATDEALRAEGFGYRAKFIVNSVQKLLEKENGGAQWLHGLRQVPYLEASEALCTLPGVGPKVAACVCLFSLDKHAAIPVDTHVWQLATRYYTPHLKGKTLTKPLMTAVELALQERFGSHAGWAHNTLFIAELASHRHLLPPHLQPGGRSKPIKAAAAAAAGVTASAAAAEALGRGKRKKVARVADVAAAQHLAGEDGEGGEQMADAAAGVAHSDTGAKEGERMRKGARKDHSATVDGIEVAELDADLEEPFASAAYSESEHKSGDGHTGDVSESIRGRKAINVAAGMACCAMETIAERRKIRDWKRRKGASAVLAADQDSNLGPAMPLVKVEASCLSHA